MDFDPAWYFDPKRWWVKTLRFLNLIEDKAVKVSITGINSWVAAANSAHALLFVHDALTIGGSLVASMTALFFHGQKRQQLLKDAKP